MSKRKRIACFFTAGYTELQAMKHFLGKINGNIDYIQLSPTQERRNKESIKNRHLENIRHNGMTGKDLIDFVMAFIQKKRFCEEGYDAILIEDDKDDRFLKEQPDGSGKIDESKWEKEKQDIIDRIHEKHPALPVILVYAAPEVEAWFLADWDNGFGKAYREVFTTSQNGYFNIVFRKYVNDIILTNRYRGCIEEYGYFGGKYWKLSDQIKNVLGEKDFLEGYMPEQEHPTVRYSKKYEGKDMLEQIDPQVVLQKCNFFFKDGFYALKKL